ncbi:MAG TPA: polynucleotide adenylyltransferase PcnB [Povalibacter sp.]|uniref:polynucleotide adenylyltransferase PcnB n=1 Tax=Povalibacter sp. TaxID=1962978 RepID=UPI002B6F53EB|nr:polynucleotide adenylyltransferase PcnB [Povalibacter sp.]HMN43437.1 polynucleotide adenylyltransferase PcnB [Povalibacter sp.]
MNDHTSKELPTDTGKPLIVARDGHPISRANISPNALKVLYRLKEAGYQAFLVGGAVRDLLLGIEPKDFDVATNAHPDQVKQLFRNCRLIGRRFHLAHVRYGYEIIEVATFRAAHTPIDEDNSVDEGGHRVLDARGRILRDNLYGTIEEDVWRRDFTANALYYNIEDFSVWDYVGGVADARARVLRLIGDPETRYREDPVRMLRAIRFAAKLDFGIEAATAAPISKLAWMLDGVPPARLFDEINKLFLSGTAVRAFDLLVQFGLLEHLFPDLAGALQEQPDSAAARLLRLGLEGTDERVRADKSVTPTFLFALLLWPAITRTYQKLGAQQGSEIQQMANACELVTAKQQSRIAVPKRFTLPMREVIAMQPRFALRSGRRALRLLDHPRFRAAYDFLLLRAAAGEVDAELATWWTEIQTLSPDERIARVEQRPSGSQPAHADGPRRRRRRRRHPAASNP